MLMAIYLIVISLIAVALLFGIIYLVRSSQRFGGERVIICPETGKQAMVGIDARHAALSSLFGAPDLRLEDCWRWPLKQDCGQECLLQLDLAPPDCLVSSVLEKWYRGKTCAFCKRRFQDISLLDHKPALLNGEGVTVTWSKVPITAASEVMATCLPVCWNCHIAQTFYREHPDLVVERSVR